MNPRWPSSISSEGVLLCERAYVLGGSVHSAVQVWQAVHSRYRALFGVPADAPYRQYVDTLGAKVVALAQYPIRHKVLGGFPGVTRLARQVLLLRAVYVTCRLIEAGGIGLVHANNSVTMNLPDLIAAWLCGTGSICHIRRIHHLNRFDQWIARRVTHFVAVSEAVKNAYVEQGIDTDRITVIHNSVPLDRFAPRPIDMQLRQGLGLESSLPCVGVFSRLTALKGVDVLLSSCALALSNGVRFQVLVVGEGPETCKLKQLAANLGLGREVRFVGRVAEVPAFLACCDVVVQPSVAPDAFPRAVIEAMTAGKPVVASRLGGIPEAITDGKTGVLVTPGDACELACAITGLLQDKERRRQMGLAAHREATERFSSSVGAKKLEEVYEAVLGQ